MNNDFEEKNTSVDFWLGLIIGGLLGGALTYLFAVDDKDEFKRSLIKKGKTLLNNLGELSKEAQQKSQELREKATEKITEIQNEIQEEAQEFQEEIEEKAQELPQLAQEAVTKVKEEANKAIQNIMETAEEIKNQSPQKSPKFFLSKGKPLIKKTLIGKKEGKS